MALRLGFVKCDAVERLNRRGRVAALSVAEVERHFVNCRGASVGHPRGKRISANSSAASEGAGEADAMGNSLRDMPVGPRARA